MRKDTSRLREHHGPCPQLPAGPSRRVTASPLASRDSTVKRSLKGPPPDLEPFLVD